MPQTAPIVFLVDVDNTLFDNDRFQANVKESLGEQFGPEIRDRYWTLQERMFHELGYRDYLGALQKYRGDYPQFVELSAAAALILDYPFGELLYPGALDVVRALSEHGPAVILTDGDVVFQPRKVERSGIAGAAQHRVLVYVHKELELEDVECRYPARHYVMVDDKLRILSAVKEFWGPRVTTVFPRQGIYAHDPTVLSRYPAADVTLDKIGDLVGDRLEQLVERCRPRAGT